MKTLKHEAAIVIGGGEGTDRTVARVLTTAGPALTVVDLDGRAARERQGAVIRAGSKAGSLGSSLPSQEFVTAQSLMVAAGSTTDAER